MQPIVKELVFATHNPNKLAEVNSMLPPGFSLCSLESIGCTEAIPETATTLEGNARLKARYVRDRYGIDCFADDTGLEVEALGGAPGVYSARYAGEGARAADNIDRLLRELQGKENRKARFRTVIALAQGDQCLFFEGIVDGQILKQPRGSEGFGYDPVFLPDGNALSFAEMPLPDKNSIGHRGKAFRALYAYLKELQD